MGYETQVHVMRREDGKPDRLVNAVMPGVKFYNIKTPEDITSVKVQREVAERICREWNSNYSRDRSNMNHYIRVVARGDAEWV